MGVCARSTIQATIGRCQDSKFEVRSGTCWRRSAPGSSRREQPFFNPMQTFPSGFGEDGRATISRIICQAARLSTLRRRSMAANEHCGRNRCAGRGFLPRPYTVVCANTNTARFLSGLDLTLQRRQYKLSKTRLLLSTKFCSVTVSKTLPFAQVCRKIPH